MTPGAEARRIALVVAAVTAVAPPGVDQQAYAEACLADSYDVLIDLAGVDTGVVGRPADLPPDLVWPGDPVLDSTLGWTGLQAALPDYDEVVLVAGDVPDLPALVLAKVFRALQRAEVCVAPARPAVPAGAADTAHPAPAPGWVALGVRLPLASWWPATVDPIGDAVAVFNGAAADLLASAAPRRGAVATAPDWHRMDRPEAVHRLDPGLEGWERTRALLAGRPLA